MIDGQELFVVANLIAAHPLVTLTRFVLRQFLFGIAADYGTLLIFELERFQLGSVISRLLAQLRRASGNCRKRRLEFTQLPVDRLETHQPGYLFTQSNLR